MSTRINRSLTDKPTVATGIGGNMYAYSSDLYCLESLCWIIGKAASSVVFHERHQCWMFRVRAERHKKNLRWWVDQASSNDPRVFSPQLQKVRR